jgi:hypothetical protein
VLCVVEKKVLCDEPVTRPRESYRVWCVLSYDIQASTMRRPWPTTAVESLKKKVVLKMVWGRDANMVKLKESDLVRREYTRFVLTDGVSLRGCTLVQALRLCTGRTAHRGSKGIDFLTTALEEGKGSASRPGRSLPPGKTRYPLYRRLGGPQGRSGQVRKISPPPGFDPLWEGRRGNTKMQNKVGQATIVGYSL